VQYFQQYKPAMTSRFTQVSSAELTSLSSK